MVATVVSLKILIENSFSSALIFSHLDICPILIPLNLLNSFIVICDWGYDKHSENKDRYQKIAMESAISLCESVLCDDSVLEEILKAENRKKNADNLMLRINAYKLFFYNNPLIQIISHSNTC